MQLSTLEHITKQLKETYHSFKAETLIAQLLKTSQLKISDIIIKCKSTFRRSHRRDISKVYLNDNAKIEITLSRNGLYDNLPEAVFHKNFKENSGISYVKMRQKYKEEENDARHFFAPLENEFFHQNLTIEQNESKLLNTFISLDDDYLINFWKVDASLPKNILIKLLKLLPYSHEISGDLELTQLCLENILKKKVVIKKKFHSPKKAQLVTHNNSSTLGVDFVLAPETNTIYSPYLEVTINDIETTEVDTYINGKYMEKFVNLFYSYFIPFEIDIKTKLRVNLNETFSLSVDESPIMGITTYI